MAVDPDEIRELVDRALAEDAPSGDLTTRLTIAEQATCRAELRAKAAGVLAGKACPQATFDLVSKQDGLGSVEVEWKFADGDSIGPGDPGLRRGGEAREDLVHPQDHSRTSGARARGSRGRRRGPAPRFPVGRRSHQGQPPADRWRGRAGGGEGQGGRGARGGRGGDS